MQTGNAYFCCLFPFLNCPHFLEQSRMSGVLSLSALASSRQQHGFGKNRQKWGKCCPMTVALMHQWAESTAPVLCRHTSAVLMTEKASPLKQSLSSQHLNSLQMPRCSCCCTGTIPANPASSGRIRPPALPCPTGKPQTTSGAESQQQSHDSTAQPSPRSHSVMSLAQLQGFFTWKSNAKYFK